MGLKPVMTPDAETVTIELTLDGQTVTAKEGVSLYDVISSAVTGFNPICEPLLTCRVDI